MDKSFEITEKLKRIEAEINNDRVDLRAINEKLAISYKYQDELAERMGWARKETENLKKDFFIKTREITEKFNRMKQIIDVHTGNFFSNNL